MQQRLALLGLLGAAAMHGQTVMAARLEAGCVSPMCCKPECDKKIINEIVTIKEQVTTDSTPLMRIGFLGEDTAAFPDYPQASFHNVPDFMKGLPLKVPESRFQGAKIKVDCPEYLGGDCDAYVLVYECLPCGSNAGHLHAYLAVEGWERSRCAPQFELHNNRHRHPMTMYRKRVPSGGSIDVEIDTPVDFVAVGGTPGLTTDCSVHDGELDKCEAAGRGGYCFLDLADNKCKPNKCVSKGPGNGCTYCVAKDVAPPRPLN